MLTNTIGKTYTSKLYQINAQTMIRASAKLVIRSQSNGSGYDWHRSGGHWYGDETLKKQEIELIAAKRMCKKKKIYRT